MANDIGSVIGGSAGSLLDLFQGNQQARQGIDIQMMGSQLAADQFVIDGAAAIQAGQYNSTLDQLKTERQLASVSRQFNQLLGSQRTTMAAVGFAPGGKSSQEIRNETIDLMTKEISRVKTDAEIRQQGIMFGAAQSQSNALTQASAARYQGEVTKFKGESEIARNTGKAIGSIGSLFGSFFE